MVIAIAILSLLVLIPYIIYPTFVITLDKFITSSKRSKPSKNTNQPRVFILMAAHNEAQCIKAKLDSIQSLNYNKNQLICLIGSDASTDKTNEIIAQFEANYQLYFYAYSERQGKPNIINKLVDKVKLDYTLQEEDLFLLTDANVLFHKNFLLNIIATFQDEKIGLVDGKMVNSNEKNGIAINESQYLQLETKIKKAEGNLWGCAMGPFGGAYCIRANLYKPVPNNFLVDDFFIFYHVLIQQKQSVLNSAAICYEAASGSLKEEFRRKVRISTGNFQNVNFFKNEIWKLWKPYNTVFLCHKLLRWISPMLVIIIIGLSVLSGFQTAYLMYFGVIMISLLLGIPLFYSILNRLHLQLKWLEALSYFIIMNFALLFGFLKYIKGVKTNVWRPTKRV